MHRSKSKFTFTDIDSEMDSIMESILSDSSLLREPLSHQKNPNYNSGRINSNFDKPATSSNFLDLRTTNRGKSLIERSKILNPNLQLSKDNHNYKTNKYFDTRATTPSRNHKQHNHRRTFPLDTLQYIDKPVHRGNFLEQTTDDDKKIDTYNNERFAQLFNHKPNNYKSSNKRVGYYSQRDNEYEYPNDNLSYDEVIGAAKTKRGKPLTIGIISAVFITLILGLFVVKNQNFMAVFQPKSPFSQSLMSSMKIPLYYPTSLPKDFKMELDSITQPEDGVLLYNISNENGDKINMTIQKQPSDIESVIDKGFNDNQNIDTKFNKAILSKSNDMTIANVLTGQSWVMISIPNNSLDESEIIKIINSLKF